MRRMIGSALLSGAIAAVGGLGMGPSVAEAGDRDTAFGLSIGLNTGSGSGFGLAYSSGRAYGPGPNHSYGPGAGYSTRYESYERYVAPVRPGHGHDYCRHHGRRGCSCRPTPPPCHEPPPPPHCGFPRHPRPYDSHRGGYGPQPWGGASYRYESRTIQSSPYPVPHRGYGY